MTAKNHWVMEQWLHWIETWSVIILQLYKHNNKVVEVLHDIRVMKIWKVMWWDVSRI